MKELGTRKNKDTVFSAAAVSANFFCVSKNDFQKFFQSRLSFLNAVFILLKWFFNNPNLERQVNKE